MARRLKPYFESYGRRKYFSVVGYWYQDFRLRFPGSEHRERFQRDWPVVLSQAIGRSNEMRSEFLKHYESDHGKEDLVGIMKHILEENGYGGDMSDVFAASKHTVESVYKSLNKKTETKRKPEPLSLIHI